MKSLYLMISIWLLTVLTGCTKIENISVVCTNGLEPNSKTFSTDYFTEASVSFSQSFSAYDTLEILLPNKIKQQIIFPYNYNPYSVFTYDFNTGSSAYAGDYIFTLKYYYSKKCNAQVATVRLDLTGSSTSPCQISANNTVYASGSTLKTYSVSYYNNSYNNYFNNKAAYRVQYSGSQNLIFYFYSNQKPKQGDLFKIGFSGNASTLNAEAELYFAGDYAYYSGYILCIEENNKTYLAFCNVSINGTKCSAKVELP